MLIGYKDLMFYRLAWLVFGVWSGLRGRYYTLFIYIFVALGTKNILFCLLIDDILVLGELITKHPNL